MLVSLACIFAVILTIALDIARKINITNKFVSLLWLLVLPHTVVVLYIFHTQPVLRILALLLFLFYGSAKIFLVPNLRREARSRRLFVMDGGRLQIIYCFYAQIIQIIVYIVLFAKCSFQINSLFVFDLLFCLIFLWTLAVSGILRIIFTSTWLSVIKRLVCILFLQFPFTNMIVMLYLIRVSGLEYEFFSFKEVREERRRILSNLCKTKYPIVMVHGVGFRDLHFFNYWGRIPKALEENGATIFYGHQEGWATIQNNAETLKNTIMKVLEETGAKKVNIIAHSKGGLDSRYAISKLGMDKYVASLTTMNTPHHGVKMANYILKLPDWLFRFITYSVNGTFRQYGDINPDFAAAAYDFTTERAALFNQKCPNSPNVFYQSYTSVLKNIFSDYILLFPYIFISLTDSKQNDGLVTAESAKWGEFRGIIKNKYYRGVSHGDIIDLKRENFRGFDVVEKYIEIVSELKDRGY